MATAKKALKRRALLLAATGWACRGTDPQPGQLARGALAAASAASHLSASEQAWALGELGNIVERARTRSGSAKFAAGALADVLFEELGFVREVSSTDLDFVLLPSVLRLRRGNCVGLGTVYLALAEELGFEAHGVLLPGHFYVRHGGPGPTQNVELLRRGEAMSDNWYRDRFPITGSHSRYYARALSRPEVLGVIAYDVGNSRRREHRALDAERAYLQATTLFADFAEAHASLAAVQHLLGRYDAAAASYQVARQLNPDLPGLDANIALLRDDIEH